MARGRGQLTPKEIELRKIISNNINALLKNSGRKQIDIHRSTGIPKSTLTGYVKGTSIPTLGNVQKLADFFGVSKSVIDPRFSSAIKSGRTSGSSIETIYNQLVPKRQQKVYEYAEKQLEEQNSKVVPLLGGVAANPAELAYGDIAAEEVVEYNVPEKADCALVVHGDSMEPDYHDGDIVFYKCQITIENGETAVVEINGDGVTLKKVYFNFDEDKVVLRSLNDKYEDRELKPEEVKVLGKVIK
ncbi:LexA family transcriptional regulator [Enterococcus casseliflavus]|uniref:LexA family transcriptional regulator n=1 Tax=Enterococcus casseliflavus TaxID=37734 RepID=UPI00232F6D28|nr:XRE family transcriptional regulator [Enterococcus casseliflavus]MDB1687470.1 XRE family transcriptional regulator [Enterococcus casseliflavus]